MVFAIVYNIPRWIIHPSIMFFYKSAISTGVYVGGHIMNLFFPFDQVLVEIAGKYFLLAMHFC
jgi:hypothetical protein